MMRHVNGPRWIVSPAFTGTKLSGTSGIGMPLGSVAGMLASLGNHRQ